MDPRIEKAKAELSEELRRLFPGLVFVPDVDGMQARAGDLSGRVTVVSRSEAGFRIEIRAGEVLLLSRYWSPGEAHYSEMLGRERRELLAMHRRLGVLLGVSDG